MPERYLYARCREEGCDKIFEGQLSWTGQDCQGKSPLIDLLQQHHLETDILAQHNSFVLFIDKNSAEKSPQEEADPLSAYRYFPLSIGVIIVTRQRNIAFSLRSDPTNHTPFSES